MLDTIQRAERCILLGQLSEAHALFNQLSGEVSRIGTGSGAPGKEFVAAFRTLKATVAKCRQRDQMLAAVYASVRQGVYRG